MRRRPSKSDRDPRRAASAPPAGPGPAGGQTRATSRRPVWKFILTFALLMVLFYGLTLTPFFDRLLYAYLVANAWLANAVLHLFGEATQISNITIRSSRFAITVRRGCDAIEPAWFFCAAVLAFPASWKARILGALAGSLLLQGLNVIRIVSLYYLGFLFPRLFSIAHLEIWPAVFIVTAMLLWIGWIRWSGRTADSHAAA